jgi:hypothetical protein
MFSQLKMQQPQAVSKVFVSVAEYGFLPASSLRLWSCRVIGLSIKFK